MALEGEEARGGVEEGHVLLDAEGGDQGGEAVADRVALGAQQATVGGRGAAEVITLAMRSGSMSTLVNTSSSSPLRGSSVQDNRDERTGKNASRASKENLCTKKEEEPGESAAARASEERSCAKLPLERAETGTLVQDGALLVRRGLDHVQNGSRIARDIS
jgi:hypothetical protein